MNKYLWTLDGGRLHAQPSNHHCNWLFLPGGPGLGSETLSGLTTLLKNKISGAIWHFDLPNDGSNTLEGQTILNWRSSIVQAATAFEKVILVAHSTLGMFVQTMPELEDILHGLVLLDSAPDASWQMSFAEYCINHTTPLILETEKAYTQNPDNEHLRQLLIASAHYSFINEKSLIAGKALIEKLPINNSAHQMESNYFDSKNYKATWVPQNVPTLILTGANDNITPLSLFQNNRLYQRNNILIEEIPDAGHYPWFENPQKVAHAFSNFCHSFEL